MIVKCTAHDSGNAATRRERKTDEIALKGRGGYAHKDGRLYPDAKPLNPATGK